MHSTYNISSLLHFLSCSKGLLKSLMVCTDLMMAVADMLRKKMTGQLLFCERLLGKMLLENLLMVRCSGVSDSGTRVCTIVLKIEKIDNLAR